MACRPETIEESAERVAARGGIGIPVQVDHTVEDQVKALFDRVQAEQGRLDLLVNDVWGGDELTEWGKPFWDLSLQKGLLMLQRAVHSHIITSRYAAPLMVARGEGLLVEITDIRLAYAMSEELRPHRITALAVTPGFLRSEAMLDHFGVTESNWREGAKKDRHFIASETPFYVGRAVAALASDPDVSKKSGKVFSSWGLAQEYGFTDVDGSRPNWGKYFEENVAGKS